MKIIFGTTNSRKLADIKNVITQNKLNLEALSLKDINWNLGEIPENGLSLAENSLIKAKFISEFCQKNNLAYPIVTDDSGIFCESLNGEPGIYTARYADAELANNPELPPYECVLKLLRELKNHPNRRASYQSCVTCLLPDGSYFQEYGQSNGNIAQEIIGPLKKPYYYTVFILDGMKKSFSNLEERELQNTYRFIALKKVLTKIK